jgi:hypothetical protein
MSRRRESDGSATDDGDGESVCVNHRYYSYISGIIEILIERNQAAASPSVATLGASASEKTAHLPVGGDSVAFTFHSGKL